MKAYLGDTQLKEKFIAQIKWHKEQDAIIQGTYGCKDGSWKGCAVACSLRSLDRIDGKTLKTEYSNHEQYETRLGIPTEIAHLEDAIFEGLPVDKAQDWPLRFSKAITPGADLSLVMPKFFVWLMKDLEQYTKPRSNQRKALQTVRKLYERKVCGEEVLYKEFEKAAGAAWAAAGAAEAAWDAAGAAAGAAKYEQMADKLIELLQAEGKK